MNEHALILGYGITIMISSLAGGYLPGLIRVTHVRMQMMLSFVGGLMLGIAVLHLIPDGIARVDDPHVAGVQNLGFAMRSLLIGLLVSFLMMRAFHFHQHGDDPSHPHIESQVHAESQASGHSHDRQRPEVGHGHGVEQPLGRSRLSWIGVVFGLSLHTFIDGIALGSAVLADAQHGTSAPLFGFGTYLAILLHKPLDAMSLTSVMLARGATLRASQWMNLVLTALCPTGAICLLWGMAGQDFILGCLLTAAAGVFLCIALSDLLPEVQFHQHDRLPLSASLLMGIAVAIVLEAFHTH